ncbi:MAG: biotin/lipoyl-containing protein [Dehalococcoidia bacterium]
MAKEIVMPQMGAEMEEGTLLRWLIQPGHFVKRGDEIAEIETDKANINLESFDEGYFLGSVLAEGTKAPVGTLIGYLGAEGEAMPAAPARHSGNAGSGERRLRPAMPVGQPTVAATGAETPPRTPAPLLPPLRPRRPTAPARRRPRRPR